MRLPPTLHYCLPVLHEDGRLRFAPWKAGGALVTNRHGIPEPDVDASALLEPEQLAQIEDALAALAASLDGTYDPGQHFHDLPPI